VLLVISYWGILQLCIQLELRMAEGYESACKVRVAEILEIGLWGLLFAAAHGHLPAAHCRGIRNGLQGKFGA
jgi:hypothetical protein